MISIIDIKLYKNIFNSDDWPVFAKSYVPDQQFLCDAITLVYPFAQGNLEVHRLWHKQIILETLRAIQHSTSTPLYAFLSNQSFVPASKISDYKRLWGRPELKQLQTTFRRSPDIRSEYEEGIRYSAIGQFEDSNLGDLVELTDKFKAVVFWGESLGDLTESRVRKLYNAVFPLIHGEPSRYVSWPTIVTYAIQNNFLCLNLDSWSPPFNGHVNAHLIFGRERSVREMFLSLRRYLDLGNNGGGGAAH